MEDLQAPGIGQQRLDVGGVARARRNLHHVGGAVAGRELHHAQPVAARVEPHGLGIDRDRAGVAREVGQIAAMLADGHGASGAPVASVSGALDTASPLKMRPHAGSGRFGLPASPKGGRNHRYSRGFLPTRDLAFGARAEAWRGQPSNCRGAGARRVMRKSLSSSLVGDLPMKPLLLALSLVAASAAAQARDLDRSSQFAQANSAPTSGAAGPVTTATVEPTLIIVAPPLPRLRAAPRVAAPGDCAG